MPTCDPLILTPACKEIIRLQPQSVLDIGIGYGKWGLLVREYAEVWKHHRLYPKDWKVKLIGCEIHKPYANPVWQLYDGICDCDALDLPRDFNDWEPRRFDLGIMIDVLEHMPREKAKPFLKWLHTVCRHVLISYSNHPQKGVGDNPNEDHVSTWHSSSFECSNRLLAGDDRSWGLFLLGPS